LDQPGWLPFRMPINRQALAAPENSYLHLPGDLTLREAFRRLIAIPEAEPWWHLVLYTADGAWATTTFDRLEAEARKDGRLLSLALWDVEELLPAKAVEQECMGTAEGRRLASRSPGSLIVVTRGGRLAGILCTPMHSGETASRAGIQRLLASGSPANLGPLAGLETTDTGPGSGRRADTDLSAAWRVGDQKVRRYTDISCPNRVALKTRRFSVVVRLTRQPSPHGDAAQALDASLAVPVRVELRAPALDILNDSEQEIPLLPERDSPPVVFDLRPRKVGDHRLELDFFQETRPLGMVVIPVKVTKGPSAASSAEASLDLPPYHAHIPPPDFVLRILWTRDVQGPSLRFQLLRQGGAGWDEFPPVPFGEAPSEYALRVFSRIGELADSQAGSAGHVESLLKIKGQNLWEILPADLRAMYTEERATWRDRSLLIVSDEPHIPWELIWPWGKDWQDEGPWCVTLRLSRWLRRDGFGNGNTGAPGVLPLRSLACLASGDIGLRAAVAEREFLHELAMRHGLQFLSPPVFTYPEITILLQTGSYDWLHVATHGTFSADAPLQQSGLWLADRTRLTPEMWVGPEITDHLRQQRPAYVLNSCESARQGWGLVGLAGWASRLVSLGAGLFLGTMWSVNDASSLFLIQEFYERLLAGDAVAEALREARLKLKSLKPNDPTWLAYSLYSHPNARCAKSAFQPSSALPTLRDR
jgi:CHAT domain-containing protein